MTPRFVVEPVMRPGWKQTGPAIGQGHSVQVVAGYRVRDNVGNAHETFPTNPDDADTARLKAERRAAELNAR